MSVRKNKFLKRFPISSVKKGRVWYNGDLIGWTDWCALSWEDRHKSNNRITWMI